MGICRDSAADDGQVVEKVSQPNRCRRYKIISINFHVGYYANILFFSTAHGRYDTVNGLVKIEATTSGMANRANYMIFLVMKITPKSGKTNERGGFGFRYLVTKDGNRSKERCKDCLTYIAQWKSHVKK